MNSSSSPAVAAAPNGATEAQHCAGSKQDLSDLACTKAFSDKDGNRFIYPSMIRWPQDDEADRPSKSDLIFKAMSLDLALGTKADKDWFEFDPAVFPHVKMDILHRNFAHGGATVMCFAGPVFEKAAQSSGEPPLRSERSDEGNAPRDEPNPPTPTGTDQ